MALYRIKDFDPDYRNHFDKQDVLGFDLYSGDEKIGSVDDLLVDDSGSFRYLVINTGVWIFGKKVLLPIGRSRISYNDHRVYVDNFSKADVENLPEYNENSAVDYDYEERVRGVYRRPTDAATAVGNTPLERSTSANAPLEGSASVNAPLERSASIDDATVGASDYNRDNYSYDREPGLFNLNDRDHQNLRLYEERLIANKRRQKTGEVSVGKHVETETARVSVPVEKERVVIERTGASDIGTPVAPGDADFREGEVARVEVYEEVPDIHKEAVVREEVNVRKEVDQDKVDAQDQIRREELDINTEGRPVVDRRPEDRPNRRI